jgi:glycosyltransferase involved in cell wall biosynthesis
VLTLPGRLTRLKGHEDFIDLVAALVAKGRDVHGLVVGYLDPARNRYISELQQRVVAKGIADRITFTGQRADMKQIYASSDMVLSLSAKPESFGRTVLEALALGVPVIGYDHGGVGEILSKLYPAGRLARGDARALLECTLQLLDTPQTVAESPAFSRSAMLEQTLALYCELAGNSGKTVL